MQRQAHLGGDGGGAAAHRWYVPSARWWARTGEALPPQTGAGTARPQAWGSEGSAPQHQSAAEPPGELQKSDPHEYVAAAATRYQGPLVLMATGEARLVVVPSPSCPTEFKPQQTMLESTFKAQLWYVPALIRDHRPASAGLSD